MVNTESKTVIVITIFTQDFFNGCDTSNLDQLATIGKMVEAVDCRLSLIYNECEVKIRLENASGCDTCQVETGATIVDQDEAIDRFKDIFGKVFNDENNWVYYE